MSHTQPFAEVIASSLKLVTGLCWDDASLPHFGSIVEIAYSNLTAYGIITEIASTITDDQRTPFAFKKSLEQLHKEQPQIFAFIQTTCTINIIWHKKKHESEPTSRTPPTPAPLHASIQLAPLCFWKKALNNRELLLSITENIALTTADDCLITIAEKAAETKEISRDELLEFIEIYSQEINNDLYRAQRFLQHMEQTLKKIQDN